MAEPKQCTVKTASRLVGIALHTGSRVALTLHPAPPDTGIVFRRMDLDGAPEVRADIAHVVDTQRGTTIAAGNTSVHTVEHLLAALNAFDVDNVYAEMTGPEPPVGDGSAVPFVDMLEQAGTTTQPAPRRFLAVDEILFCEQAGTKLMVVPDKGFRVSCTVKYGLDQPVCQYLDMDVTRDSFVAELSKARTFCLYHEIEALIKANLICGGSLDNAVVLKDNVILSKEGLRYTDEFVRHKMLDMVGDFYLLGQRLRAQIIAVRPGHAANITMARIIRERLGG